MEKQFETAIEKQEKVIRQNQSLFYLVGFVKLVLFVLFAVTVYWMVTRWDNQMNKVLVLLLLAVQIAVWLYHQRIGHVIAHAKGLTEIYQRQISRIQGRWTGFPDIGKEFIDMNHPYSRDLDIVGQKSLFQFLNTAHTWYGRHAFADDLLHASYSKEQIEQRQKAVTELSKDAEFSAEMEYRFAGIGNSSFAPKLVKELQTAKPFLKSKLLRGLLMYVPLLVVLLLGIVFLFRLEQYYLPALLLLAVQFLVWIIGIPSTRNYLHGIQQVPFKLNAYRDVLDLVAETAFSAERLQQIQTELLASDYSAVRAMKELDQIVGRVSAANNPIANLVLNILLLWDYECAIRLAEWKLRYAPHCEKWFTLLGELESLQCFAVMPNVCKNTCMPAISQHRGIEAKGLGHPLIPNEVRVTNPLNLKDRIMIISGSNMSGKTTYLRTAGINIVLARAGGAVCAESMTCSDLHLATSMRIADDLNEGISTFYAELKRIKMILESSEHDPDTLFLIDEIFRGTNSVDRLSGAEAVIQKLHQRHISGMITTHDLELCELQKAIPQIENYSFSESYQDGKIHFDYQLKEGKSKTTNAKYLMEMLGIL